MELQYPSDKETNLSYEIDKIDKRYGSIIFSTPVLPTQTISLSNSVKKSLRECISKDKSAELLAMMKKKGVKLSEEISKKGFGWNILHFISKHNSSKCLQCCLKTAFQQNPKSYHKILQSKTIDEDTPLIIAFQCKSNKVIRLLLQYGGVDIYAMNIKKMTAYQIAELNQNEEGLKLLMKYELKIKQKDYLNISALNTPVQTAPENTCQNCFWNCVFRLFHKDKISHDFETKTEAQTDRNLIKTPQHLQQLGIFEIEWKKPKTLNNQTPQLFSEKTNPFHIRQNSIIVSNLLIIFQCLAKYPEILKKIIFKVGEKFYVHFFSIYGDKIIWVDNLFPFLNHTQQPMFLSLQQQVWPMVLQKALCQYYFGYFQPGKVALHKILQSIISSSSYIINIPEKPSFSVLKLISKLQQMECIYVLKARQSCQLRSLQGRKQCFSVLKVLENKILINCAFVTDQEKNRETEETIQMKMSKVHYRNPSTMSIWISIPQFHQFFEQLIFCHTKCVHLPKKSIKPVFLYGDRIYIKIKDKNERKKNKVCLSLKDKESLLSLLPEKVNGLSKISSKNGSKQRIEKTRCEFLGDIMLIMDENCDELILQIMISQGNREESQIIVRFQSDYQIQVEPLDGLIGELQYLQYYKNYYKNTKVSAENLIIQEVGQYFLVISTIKKLCLIQFCEPFSEDNIVQGILTDNYHKIQMLKDKNINFVILTNVCREDILKMKVIESKIDGI